MPAIGAEVRERLAAEALAMFVEPPRPRGREVSGVLTPVLEADKGGTRFAEESRRRDGS